MNTSDHFDANDSAAQPLTRRVYREQFVGMGRRLLGLFLVLFMAGTVLLGLQAKEAPFWASAAMFSLFVGFALWLLVWHEVTVDSQTQAVREAWRVFGWLTVWKRQRSIRDFAAVRCQRVETRTGVICEVYFVPRSKPDQRCHIDRFQMGKDDERCPKALAVGQELARFTQLPLEDKS